MKVTKEDVLDKLERQREHYENMPLDKHRERMNGIRDAERQLRKARSKGQEEFYDNYDDIEEALDGVSEATYGPNHGLPTIVIGS